MLNESVYCPRLFYLEWVDQEWCESADTVEGKTVHRRVDTPSPPPPDDGDAPAATRSLHLADEELGLTARIDLVEGEGEAVRPVDYKKGRKPEGEDELWPADRVQVGAAALLLRAHGYSVPEATVYYAGSKARVDIPVDADLEARTLAARAAALEVAASDTAPPPLVDSPKCRGCSLAPLCLPDEVGLLTNGADRQPRRLMPARDDPLPVYVQEQGCAVGVRAGRLRVTQRGEKRADLRLIDVSDLCVFGGVQVSTAAIRELSSRAIPVLYFSRGGWFYSMVTGLAHKNVRLRQAQYAAAADENRSLELARSFVAAKIKNQRTLLRRNHGGGAKKLLARLSASARRAGQAKNSETLLGVEGSAARTYFEGFPEMLKRRDLDGGFSFEGRNKRPPRDPVNALLSFVYALLAKDVTVSVAAVGFDPMLGFYHHPRYGRPSLALDLMEELRPIVADSTVLRVINNGEIKPDDFVGGRTGVALKERARKALIQAYTRRIDELVTHPIFGYRISYRRIVEVQARLLGRFLLGEIDDYRPFQTR